MLLTHTHTHTVTLYEIPGRTCTEMFSSCEYRKYQTKTINIETVEYVQYIVQCSTWVTRQERDLISLEFNNSTEVTLTQLHIYSYMSSEKKKIYKAGQS